MEKISIIDIQGVQWAIKDQDATVRIDKLEEKTNVKKTRLWEGPGSYFELVEISGVKYYNVFFQGTPYISEIGETIFTIPNVGQVQDYNRIMVSGDRTDYKGRVPVILEISKEGVVKAFHIIENQISGSYPEINLFGQAFVMVN